MEKVENKTVCCAVQHIKIFRDQAIKGELADFGEPCQGCIHSKDCDFNWLSILSPLVDKSPIKISMVDQEPIPLQGKSQSENLKDKDIRPHGGKKNE